MAVPTFGVTKKSS